LFVEKTASDGGFFWGVQGFCGEMKIAAWSWCEQDPVMPAMRWKVWFVAGLTWICFTSGNFRRLTSLFFQMVA
jgi:hypothetical protein